VSYSGGVSAVVHHKHLQLGNIVDDNTLKSIRTDVSGRLIGTVSDTGHGNGSLESTTNASINTLGFAPRGIANTHKLIGLMPSELLRSLLDNSLLIQRDRSSHLDSIVGGEKILL